MAGFKVRDVNRLTPILCTQAGDAVLICGILEERARSSAG
jgi:hypothetical protein